jgi:hypothetical protein
MTTLYLPGQYPGAETYFGGSPQFAGDYFNRGLQLQNAMGAQAGGFNNLAASGPNYAYENRGLAQNDADIAGGDQAGSIQLDREAAMGLAPSAAAYDMQRGLNQAVASQRGQVASARGNAGVALAQGNVGGNIAALQQQAFLNAQQMRAQEMAQARGQYGQDVYNARAQNQNRLNMGNQMSQYNSTLGSNYALGMGGLANQALGMSSGQYVNSLQPIQGAMNADQFNYNTAADAYNHFANNQLAIQGVALNNDQTNNSRAAGAVGTGLTVAGTAAGAAFGGPGGAAVGSSLGKMGGDAVGGAMGKPQVSSGYTGASGNYGGIGGTNPDWAV